MVIDADELGLEALASLVVGTVVGVAVVSVLLILVVSRSGRRRFDGGSFVLSLAVVVAALVVGVVVWRTVDGDATGWDLLWAAGFAVIGWQCARRLFGRRGAITRPAGR